jgi:hypothetical protein
MVPIAISSLAFVLMLLGIAAGGWVQGRLPEGHLSPDSKEVIKLSMGVMGTLAALVLGLLVANTQNSYSARILRARAKSNNSLPTSFCSIPC